MSNKAVFMDRDDTLIEDPGYINSPDQVKLITGVARALIRLREMGYKLVVVTNQSAVARGIVTEKTLGQIHERLEELLSEQGALLDGIYYCPYHPEGAIPKYRKQSECRKPGPGMLLAAADELDIDLGRSWMVGDSSSDIAAGLQAGCKTILIDPPSRIKKTAPDDPSPHYHAVNLVEAANIIKQYERSTAKADLAEPSGELASPEQACIPEQGPPASQNDEAYEPRQSDGDDSDAGPTADKNEQSNTEHPAQDNEPEPPAEKPTSGEPADVAEMPEQVSAPKDELQNSRELLCGILEQLKAMQRNTMFEEFSVLRFIAGVMQMAVLLCLLITIYILMLPNRQDTSVLIALGFAVVMQLMALTFFVMQSRR